MTFLFIVIGASLGAYARYGLGLLLNSLFPTLPLGTLAANLLGAFLIGIVMALSSEMYISEKVMLGVVTGFLGSLSTMSTFTAELVTLLGEGSYLWFALSIGAHVGGSILMALIAIAMIKGVTT
ncbi:MAG: CrcB family protein [Simkaniaceae bacterium]|nr:CrcB family protein [Simkaniaceae bacterium]